jgi:hypothetical protein
VIAAKCRNKHIYNFISGTVFVVKRMSGPENSTRKTRTKGGDSEKTATTRKRQTTDNSQGERSLGLTPGADSSANASQRGVPKAISAKDGRATGGLVKPSRANDNATPADKRALPGAKGSEKNPKTKKQMLKEKEKEKQKTDKKKKSRKTKRSVMDRILLSMGFAVGKVVLVDPRAVEAANSLR